jgi:hypothetical protein
MVSVVFDYHHQALAAIHPDGQLFKLARGLFSICADIGGLLVLIRLDPDPALASLQIQGPLPGRPIVGRKVWGLEQLFKIELNSQDNKDHQLYRSLSFNRIVLHQPNFLESPLQHQLKA